ncbi:MAG: ShlB/FhaC/HecB family hemolysin secretion/activation protein [Caulobacteraceae bacterium]|nr:ShlB/FhaC/HecB family hemolysin secretion/activation protein [Caulobacteraceae bacterium]
MRYSRLIAARWGVLLLGFCAAIGCAPDRASAQSAGPAAAPTPTFDIEAYDVDGAKMLSQLDIETAVYPYLGPGRTAADIDKARAALQKVYADRGLQSVAVELPMQSVADHIVRLHVVEARIGRVRVVGARYFSPDLVRQQVPSLREGEVPDLNQTQKELAQVNTLADRRVTPDLKSGAAPGTVDVDLDVADSLPLHGSLELNNDHSQGTRPLRLTANASYANLWQLGHSLSFTYTVAPQARDQSEVYYGAYSAPLWGSSWTLQLSGYVSNSNATVIGAANVLGKGSDMGVKAFDRLPAFGSFIQSASLGIDYRISEQNTAPDQPCAPSLETAAGPERGTCPQVHYFPFSASYTLQRVGNRFNTTASLSVTANAFGDNTSRLQEARFNTAVDFAHLNLDIAQTEMLGYGVAAYQHLSGQITDEPLVSAEEFAAGGLTSVRGYLQSEATGDNGFSGTFELRSPSFANYFGRYLDELRVYGFADGAVVHVLLPATEQTANFHLASLGLGLHVELLKHLSGDVLGAVPLTKGVVTHRDKPRLTFSLKSDF